MRASVNRRAQAAAEVVVFAGGAVARWRGWRRRGGVLAAAGLILWLGSSCASSGRKQTKDKASAAAATPAPGMASNGSANGNNAPTGATGRFVASAHVDNGDDATAEAPSPGRELIAHALSGTGANPTQAAAGTEMAGNGVPAAGAERRVGVVRVIGAHGKFVLIETTYGATGSTVAEGEELRCRGPATTGGAQTAVLKVARERQAPFLVADVVSGEPQAGDIAYLALEKKNGNSTSR